MPVLNVALSGNPGDSLKKQIAKSLTRLTQKYLGKDPALTAVIITPVAGQNWFIDAAALQPEAEASFSLHITVTQGTNTKQQIANYDPEAAKARYEKALADCKDSQRPVQALIRLKVLFQVFGLDLEDNEELAGTAGVNESALVDMLGRTIDQWWSQRVAELRAHCPRCGVSVLPGSTCPHCGASLEGTEGAALVRALEGNGEEENE